jgi:dienelactone hydrolase
MPLAVVDLMKNKITKPANWFTTLFYKPLWIFQAASMVLPWLFYNRPSVAKPRVFNFFQALRTSPPPFPTPNLKIGAAGFCWGGKYTILLAANTPSSRVIRHESQASSPALEALIDCGFTAHPSMVSVPKDIEPVTVPLSVAVGNEDMAMSTPLIQQMKEILEKKKDDHEVVIMPGAKHGFAVRTDPEEPLQMECADKAEVQAISWFSRWLI